MLTPTDFGLPPKFAAWRPGQLDAIDLILNSPQRVVCICAPTGFGKTIAYLAALVMSGKRGAVCTSTKGLQDQILSDFHVLRSFADIRGQSNYQCNLAPKLYMPAYTTVEMGPCHSGVACEMKYNGECGYYARYAQARKSDIVSTNYALWMYDKFKSAQEDKRDGNLLSQRPVDILVLDEAHDAPEQLASFVGAEISYVDCQHAKILWPQTGVLGEDLDAWRAWANASDRDLVARIEQAQEQAKYGRTDAKFLREVGEWRRVQRKVAKVSVMHGEWCVEEVKPSPYSHAGPSVRFDPLWPAHYADSELFRGVAKVVLVSATVRPKTAELLGVSAPDVNFREFPSSFPPVSRPVIHVPTVQMNYRTEQDDSRVMWWLQRMDGIIDARLDRKGIVHTVSYKRAALILENSRHASRMLLHDSRNRAEVIGQFKSSPPGTVLLSPSVDTGYDFPYQECEYQIIAKLPFEPTTAKVVKARMKSDPEYGNYMTAQTLVQMTGRGMRAVDDRCETLIVDDNITWFVGAAKRYLPKWWLDSVQLNVNRPQPLEKL